MTDKELLLKDFCARLPYGVKVHVEHNEREREWYGISGYDTTATTDSINKLAGSNFKPYLRPMSSMTEKEKKEYTSYCFEQPFLQENKIPNLGSVPMCVDWLNAHYFDYRGLIEKGLAIEAPEGMYK